MGRVARALTTATCVLVAGVMATTTVANAATRSVSADAEFGTEGIVVLQQGSAVRDSEPDGTGGMYVAGTVATSTGVFWRIEHLDEHGDHIPTFGTQGIVMLAARNASAYFVSLEVQGDHLYAVGSDGERGFTVTRLTMTGAVDRTFGTRGAVRLSVKGVSLVSISDAAVTPTGRIIVLGNLADPTSRLRVSSFVARLTAAGRPDATFGQSGVATVDVTTGGTSQNITQLAIDARGRIIVAGSRIAPVGQEMVVARLTSRGRRDGRFGTSGVRILQPVRGAVSAVSSIAVAADGSLTLGGWSRTGTAREPVQSVVVVRLTMAGRLDTSFNGDGIARTTDPRFNDQVTTDLAVRADGSLLVSTSPVGVTAKPAFVVHVTVNGALAARVGVKGVTPIVYVTGQRSWTQMIHLVDDHLYVLGGTAVGLGTPSATIARFDLA